MSGHLIKINGLIKYSSSLASHTRSALTKKLFTLGKEKNCAKGQKNIHFIFKTKAAPCLCRFEDFLVQRNLPFHNFTRKDCLEKAADVSLAFVKLLQDFFCLKDNVWGFWFTLQAGLHERLAGSLALSYLSIWSFARKGRLRSLQRRKLAVACRVLSSVHIRFLPVLCAFEWDVPGSQKEISWRWRKRWLVQRWSMIQAWQQTHGITSVPIKSEHPRLAGKLFLASQGALVLRIEGDRTACKILKIETLLCTENTPQRWTDHRCACGWDSLNPDAIQKELDLPIFLIKAELFLQDPKFLLSSWDKLACFPENFHRRDIFANQLGNHSAFPHCLERTDLGCAAFPHFSHDCTWRREREERHLWRCETVFHTIFRQFHNTIYNNVTCNM